MRIRKTNNYTNSETVKLGFAKLIDGLINITSFGTYSSDCTSKQLRKILKRQIEDRKHNSIKLQSEAEMTSPPEKE
jgi:hypothetical protein